MNTYTIRAQLSIELASQFASHTSFTPSNVNVTFNVRAASEAEAFDIADEVIENQSYLSILDPHIVSTQTVSNYTSIASIVNAPPTGSTSPEEDTDSNYTRLT